MKRIFLIVLIFGFFGGINLSAEETANSDSKEPKVKLPVPITQIVLMPTAYRTPKKDDIGVELEMDLTYFFTQIYGKNTLSWTNDKKDSLTRIGIWNLSLNGKMTVQSESTWRPAIAVGAQGMLTFRDSKKPTLDTQTEEIDQDVVNLFGGVFVSASKRFSDKYITNLGFMYGSTVDRIFLLSKYLSDESITLSGHPNQSAKARSMFYGGATWLITPNYPVGVEFMIPQGAPMKPRLINFNLGRVFNFNFGVSYLTFDGGWDTLAFVQFRQSIFPKPK
jgi:hypothetical protein